MSGWSEAIPGRHPVRLQGGEPAKIGILPGEGIGPEVIDAATVVLTAVAAECGRDFELRPGTKPPAGGATRSALEDATAEFCRGTFAAGGAILTGPHGGRWVYELRQRFDLFCKISPLRPAREIGAIDAPISPRRLEDVDLLVVREQSAGVYQGRWSETDARRDGPVAEHSFSYTRREVRRIIEVAAALAAARSGRMTTVVKQGGIPTISRLWRDCAEEVATHAGVACEVLDADYALYRLLRDPRSLDVIVAPNLFGDLLSDAGGALLGSRALCYGGSFDGGRAAVYQTNHGAAHDLAGTDRANPVGQILAAAMMLRESFALEAEAELIERAVAAAWRGGWRTEDLAEPGCRVVGTREMGERVAESVGEISRRRPAPAGEAAGGR